MIRKNSRSDFCFFLELYDAKGHKLDIPDYNFSLKVTTSGNSFFHAFRKGDIMKGFVIRENRILVVCDRHGLLPGVVKVAFEADIPNSLYPDGFEHVYRNISTDIQLTDKESDEDLVAMVNLALPVLYADSISECTAASDDEIISSATKVFNR